MYFSSILSSYYINGKEQESNLKIQSNMTGDKKDEMSYVVERKKGQYNDKTGKLTKNQASHKIEKKLKDIKESFEKYLTKKRKVLQQRKNSQKRDSKKGLKKRDSKKGTQKKGLKKRDSKKGTHKTLK